MLIIALSKLQPFRGGHALAKNSILGKRCLSCRRIKAHSEFHADGRRPDALKARCKACADHSISLICQFCAKCFSRPRRQPYCTRRCAALDRISKRRSRVAQLGALGKKHCSKCRTVKNREEFNTDKATIDGLRAWCKKCTVAWKANFYKTSKGSLQKKRRAERWARSVRGKIARRRKHLKKFYGITLEIYDELLRQQGGVCAICRMPPDGRQFGVDHCHATNQVRGILCGSCNNGLGLFRDNIKSLTRAALYLHRSQMNKELPGASLDKTLSGLAVMTVDSRRKPLLLSPSSPLPPPQDAVASEILMIPA